MSPCFAFIVSVWFFCVPSALGHTGVSSESSDHCLPTQREDILWRGLTCLLWEEEQDIHELTAPLDALCATAIREIRSHLAHGRKDAYELLDYSSKGITGVLDGQVIALGEYDSCLKRGQYCSVRVVTAWPPWPHCTHCTKAIDVTFDLCLPSSCSRRDVEKLIQVTLSHYPVAVVSLKNDSAITCDSVESNSWHSRVTHLSHHQITSVVFLCILVIVRVVSSLSDLINVDSCFASFSLRRSMSSLLSHRKSIDAATFSLHTVKVTIAILSCESIFLYLTQTHSLNSLTQTHSLTLTHSLALTH